MIRILILGQTRLMCDTISVVVSREKDMQVEGKATNEREIMRWVNRANLLLVHTSFSSYTFGKRHGRREDTNQMTDFIQALASKTPRLKIVVLGLPDQVPIILHYLESGANGYVLSEESTETLVQKIRAVYNGRPSICPEVTAALMERVTKLSHGQALPANKHILLTQLTEREREVLQLIDCSLSNRMIAQRLHIEVGTVKNHVHSILKKLNVANRYEATLYLPLLFDHYSSGTPTAVSI